MVRFLAGLIAALFALLGGGCKTVDLTAETSDAFSSDGIFYCGRDISSGIVRFGSNEEYRMTLSEDNPSRVEFLGYLASSEDWAQVNSDAPDVRMEYAVVEVSDECIAIGGAVREVYNGKTDDYGMPLVDLEVRGYISRTYSGLFGGSRTMYYDAEYTDKLLQILAEGRVHELAGKTFDAYVERAEADNRYCILSEEYGEMNISVSEPMDAVCGDLLRVTIDTEQEDAGWYDALIVNAENTTNGNVAAHPAENIISEKCRIYPADNVYDYCDIITDRDTLEFETGMHCDSVLSAESVQDILSAYNEDFFAENVLTLLHSNTRYGGSWLSVGAVSTPADGFIVYITENVTQGAQEQPAGHVILLEIPRSRWNERYPNEIRILKQQ